MKFNLKYNSLPFKGLVVSGLLLASLSGISQGRLAVIADAQLGKMELSDYAGYTMDAGNLSSDQLIKLKLPVFSVTHGKALPAGTCKIKIGFGSKLMLDPGFDLNNAGMSNYFRWTAAENSGQLQVTGELVNTLPANVTAIDLSFRLKVKEEGNSAITANFLITNHNSTTILSDENGANNSSFMAYKVGRKLPLDPSLANGNLKLSIFPNPAKDVKAVNIKVMQGKLLGKYKVSLFDLSGKLVQTKEIELNLVNNFVYNFGTLAAGQYMISVKNVSGTESSVLKFEKL